MSLFSSFALCFGSLLALMALIAAWLFRTAAAPLWARVAVPSLAVSLSCYAPLSVSHMMGYPVSVSFSNLPEAAELVAFVPRDEEKRVDLWLIDGSNPGTADAPRAYETAMTASMKKALRQAQGELARGRPAMLKKRASAAAGSRPGGGASDPLGVGDDQQMYVLDPSALGLPPKE